MNWWCRKVGPPKEPPKFVTGKLVVTLWGGEEKVFKDDESGAYGNGVFGRRTVYGRVTKCGALEIVEREVTPYDVMYWQLEIYAPGQWVKTVRVEE